MSKPTEVSALKIGQHIVISDIPCRIVEYEKSKPGKHGSAKARIVAIGIFDGQKRSMVSPVDARVDVPIIEKRNAQVVSLTNEQVQLMDLETFDVFYTSKPDAAEIRDKLNSGQEVEYWRVLGKIRIVRIKGQA